MDNDKNQIENSEENPEKNNEKQSSKRKGLFSFLRSDGSKNEKAPNQEEEIIDSRLGNLEVKSEAQEEQQESKPGTPSKNPFPQAAPDWGVELGESKTDAPFIEPTKNEDTDFSLETGKESNEVFPALQSLDEISQENLQGAETVVEEDLKILDDKKSDESFSYAAFSERMDAFAETTEPNNEKPIVKKQSEEQESYADFSSRLDTFANKNKDTEKTAEIPLPAKEESFEEFSARIRTEYQQESEETSQQDFDSYTAFSDRLDTAAKIDDPAKEESTKGEVEGEALNLYNPEDSKPIENPDFESAFPMYTSKESDPFAFKEDADESEIEIEFPNIPQDEEIFTDPNLEQTHQVNLGEIPADKESIEDDFSSLRGSFIDDDVLEEETQYSQQPYIKPLPDTQNPFTVNIETLSDEEIVSEEEIPLAEISQPEQKPEPEPQVSSIYVRTAERGLPEREAREENDEDENIRDSFALPVNPFETLNQNREVVLEEIPQETESFEFNIQTDDRQEDEETIKKKRRWWIISAVVAFLFVAIPLTFFGIRHLISLLPERDLEPEKIQATIQTEAGVHPIGLRLPGGWYFLLQTGNVIGGEWTPTSAEWLFGTEVQRIVAVPWTKQLEGVIDTFEDDLEVQLVMSNNDIFNYYIKSVEQVPRSQIEILSKTEASLVIIVYQEDTDNRWVITCLP